MKKSVKPKILMVFLLLFLAIALYNVKVHSDTLLATGSNFEIYIADSTLGFQATYLVDFECVSGIWNATNSALSLRETTGTLSFDPLDDCSLFISTVSDRAFEVRCSGAVLTKNYGNYSAIVTAQTGTWTTPSTVHSECGEKPSYPPTKAIDDNIYTHWWHDSGCYHWIIFDMGESESILKIRLYQSAISEYRWGKSLGLYVYVSDNPTSWGDAVWEGILNAADWQETAMFSESGRYIKLVSKSNATDQYMYEFDAYTITGSRATISWRYSPWSMIDNYFMLGVGITGIVMLIAGPTWFARTFIKHGLDPDTIEHLGYAMLFVVMGFGFMVVWLWPG